MSTKDLPHSSEDFWRALEAERHSISYRKQVTEPEPVIRIKTVTKVPERLKKIYFHAGRYSAGDRDDLAKASYYKMEAIERS